MRANVFIELESNMKQVSYRLWHSLIGLMLLMALPSLILAASDSIVSKTESTQKYIILDGRIEALTLTPGDIHYKGIDPEKLNSRYFNAQLNDNPDSKGRFSVMKGVWQGLMLHNDQIYLIRAVYDQPPANPRTLKSSQAIAPDQPLGTCAASLHPGAKPHAITASALTAPVTTQAITIGDFDAFCEDTVDGVCLVAELSVMFDVPFQNVMGEDYQEQAIAMLEYVEFLYRERLNIAFRHLSIDFDNSGEFSASNNIDVVLNDIANQRAANLFTPTAYDPNRRALFHLVSGKEYTLDGDTGVLGLAFTPDYESSTFPTDFDSVLCTTNAAGTSQIVTDFDSEMTPNVELTALVLAHEIGHNFGFDHDGFGIAASCSDSQFIMGPSLGLTPPTQFSSCSIDALNANIQQVNTLENCFNFPVDLGLQNSNSEEPLNQASFIRAYTVTASTRNNETTPILVAGEIPPGDGEFTSVTLAGTPCTLLSSTEYLCSLNNATSLSSLEVSVSAQSLNFTISHELAPDPDPDGDIYFDIDGANNRLVDAITVNAENQPPDSLTATTSGRTLTLNWQDRSTNELSFSVQRQRSDSTWVTIAEGLAANSRSYQDSGLDYDTEYTYRVIGHFPGDLQLASDAATFRTQAKPNVKKRSSKGSLDVALILLLTGGLGLRLYLSRLRPRPQSDS